MLKIESDPMLIEIRCKRKTTRTTLGFLFWYLKKGGAFSERK